MAKTMPLDYQVYITIYGCPHLLSSDTFLNCWEQGFPAQQTEINGDALDQIRNKGHMYNFYLTSKSSLIGDSQVSTSSWVTTCSICVWEFSASTQQKVFWCSLKQHPWSYESSHIISFTLHQDVGSMFQSPDSCFQLAQGQKNLKRVLPIISVSLN